MSVTARLTPVVAMLLAALVDGSLNTRHVLAEDNCLSAPNARAPQGSHWYYRTDPVKQSKCWYLRTEGPAAQKPAAQETTETKFSVEGLAVTPPKSVSDQLGPSSLELRPAQAAQAADKPTKMNIPNNTQPNRQAANARAWPNPPVPAAAKVAWPDPPAPTAANNVAWPDPPAPNGSQQRGVARASITWRSIAGKGRRAGGHRRKRSSHYRDAGGGYKATAGSAYSFYQKDG